jgi:hypothetical protein
MQAQTERFVRSVVVAVPSLQPILDEHMSFYDELLPHVLMGDITRWAEYHAADSLPLVRHLLEEFEKSYASGEDDVRELLTVSFLENLSDDTPIVRLLGPGLRNALEELRADSEDK